MSVEETRTKFLKKRTENGKDSTPPVSVDDDARGSSSSCSSEWEGLDAATACYEIFKSCVMAAITLCAMVLVGAHVAIPLCLGLYLISRRFASELDSKGPRKKPGSPTGASKREVPEDFERINWVQLSRLIPGLDAERLKETFEYLYGRVSRGTLEVKRNGEWEEISPLIAQDVGVSRSNEAPRDMDTKKNQ